MKQMIDGTLYNTETATKVGSASGNPRSHNSYSEGLYRSRRGHWFLAGEGGPASAYAVTVGGNASIGGAGIIALDRSEVLEWIERHGLGALEDGMYARYASELGATDA